jgi:hypothetical protein
VNIAWNSVVKVFVAEFSFDFAADLEAVKAAGFRPLGIPPPWIWHAPPPGVKALNRLRANKPASGLSINSDALAIYQPMAEQEEKNEAIRKQVVDLKKKVKKEKKESEKATPKIPEGKMWIGPEDLPPMPKFTHAFVPSPPPDLKCFVCQQPVYPYEYPDIPMCLWCAKTSEK